MNRNPWCGALLSVMLSALPACSLLSIKTPETPLTPREQEARLLTRDYADHFNGVMIRAGDGRRLSNVGRPTRPSLSTASRMPMTL